MKGKDTVGTDYRRLSTYGVCVCVCVCVCRTLLTCPCHSAVLTRRMHSGIVSSNGNTLLNWSLREPVGS